MVETDATAYGGAVGAGSGAGSRRGRQRSADDLLDLVERQMKMVDDVVGFDHRERLVDRQVAWRRERKEFKTFADILFLRHCKIVLDRE